MGKVQACVFFESSFSPLRYTVDRFDWSATYTVSFLWFGAQLSFNRF